MEKKDITVSVVIPVYNVSAYIERCIQSVMSQTYNKFECILVDDASPDDSIEKCKRMIEAYNGPIQFHILHHPENRGLSVARNSGANAATGDYILFIDSDDAITPDCVEKLMVPILRDGTIEIVMGNEKRFLDGYPLKSVRTKRNQKREDLRSNKTVRDYYFDKRIIRVNAWNKLIRKDFLYQHELTFKEGLLWEDNLWMFFVMKYLEHLFIIEDVTYLKYVRPGSITTSSNLKTKQGHWAMIFYEISNNLTPNDSKRETKFYLKEFCSYYIIGSDIDSYQKIAHVFRKELSYKYDTELYLRLVVTGILAKTWIGRKSYIFMRKIFRQIRQNI